MTDVSAADADADVQLFPVRRLLKTRGEEDREIVVGLPAKIIDEIGAEIAWKEEAGL